MYNNFNVCFHIPKKKDDISYENETYKSKEIVKYGINFEHYFASYMTTLLYL